MEGGGRFELRDGERTYRTGDLVRRAGDAFIFERRLDAQFKRRGHRIEPAEIEAALIAGGVADDVAVTALDRAGRPNDELVAFIVTERPINKAGLRAAARASLPEPMRPDRYEQVADLPRNPNGKVDRDALHRLAAAVSNPVPPAPAGDGSAAGPPRPLRGTADDLLVSTVQHLFELVLDRAGVGPHDEFFLIGGSSISAVELQAQLLEVTGAEVPIGVLLNAPTPAELASRIRDLRRSAGTTASPSAHSAGGRTAPHRIVTVPCAGEAGSMYAEILARVPDDLAVARLAAPGVHDEPHLGVSVEALAERYLVEAQPVAANAVLLGFSFGGAVAMGLGVRLAEHGLPPALIIVVDAKPPRPTLRMRVAAAPGKLLRSPPGKRPSCCSTAACASSATRAAWRPLSGDSPLVRTRPNRSGPQRCCARRQCRERNGVRDSTRTLAPPCSDGHRGRTAGESSTWGDEATPPARPTHRSGS